MEIKHIFEPTPLQCGQAVLAMVANVSVEEITKLLLNQKETTLKEMFYALKYYGFNANYERKEFVNKEQLPTLALLSLETPKCWHWSLYYNGIFYDPEYGKTEKIPPSKRRYFWEIENKP